MGGADESNWYERPERTAVLIGTQDLLLSRALMRGYGMSRYRWPVDFALLHNDAQWVFDEVQLMSAGLATSAQLDGFRQRLGTDAASSSLWISATLHPGWLGTVDHPTPGDVWCVPADFPDDAASPRVRRLIDAPKPIVQAATRPASARKADLGAYADALAAEALALHRAGRLTLIILNTVVRAQQVYAALVKAGTGSDRLVLIHSRFRPADRAIQMEKLPEPGQTKDLIVVATQAIEAGVDVSSAVLITELAPPASLVQRFGRVNRYGELNDSGGGTIRWIDLLTDDALAAPYDESELAAGRASVMALQDACSANLAPPGPDDVVHRGVIRCRDLLDLYDTDPDLTGFDVDVSPFVRDAEDTDVHIFWRDFDPQEGPHDEPAPRRDELCAVPIGRARDWIGALRRTRLRAYREDPQARRRARGARRAIPWMPLDGAPWPGLVLMLPAAAGGYLHATGFDAAMQSEVEPIHQPEDAAARAMAESLDSDPETERQAFVRLTDHLHHVAAEAEELCAALDVAEHTAEQVVRAARWHDLGKAHPAFQGRLLASDHTPPPPTGPFAKAPRYDMSKGRRYFRHELATSLAYLAHSDWSRDADLVAFLIAAHHGKVRTNLRALPAELAAADAGRPARFARGVWEGDRLPALSAAGGIPWEGGELSLSVMEMGHDPQSGSSWTERTSDLLARYGPFRLAWMEALVRVADWRASDKEERGDYGG